MNSANFMPTQGPWIEDRKRTMGHPSPWKLSILSILCTVFFLLASMRFHFKFGFESVLDWMDGQ